jgi:hypothetical protein
VIGHRLASVLLKNVLHSFSVLKVTNGCICFGPPVLAYGIVTSTFVPKEREFAQGANYVTLNKSRSFVSPPLVHRMHIVWLYPATTVVDTNI